MSMHLPHRDSSPPERAVLTFAQWRRKVDQEIGRRIGCSIDDLPDQPYRDWFDHCVNSTQAAIRAIRNAGGPVISARKP